MVSHKNVLSYPIPVRITPRGLHSSTLCPPRPRHDRRNLIECKVNPLKRHRSKKSSTFSRDARKSSSVPSRRERFLVKVPRQLRLRCSRVQNYLPSLLLTNVRSLSNKLDEVEQRVSSLTPDVVFLTETCSRMHKARRISVELHENSRSCAWIFRRGQ